MRSKIFWSVCQMHSWYSSLRFTIGPDILITRFAFFSKAYWIILCIFLSVRHKGRTFWKVNRYLNHFRIIKMAAVALVTNGHWSWIFVCGFWWEFLEKTIDICLKRENLRAKVEYLMPMLSFALSSVLLLVLACFK